MYKVLLADDERLDLEGFKRLIPWSDLNMEVVASVTSGFAALRCLEEQQVDILVTDIQMPIMTGLELARVAMETWPHLKIVFISGHEDFQYAKQAIAMHASGYVLKPVDDDELAKVLMKASDSLRREREQSANEIRLRHTMPIVKNELMLRWLEGAEDETVVDSLFDGSLKPWKNRNIRIAVVEIDDMELKLRAFDDSRRTSILRELFDRMSARLVQDRIEVVCKIDASRMAVVLGDDHSAACMQSLIGYMHENTIFSVTVGLGSVVSIDKVAESYKEARHALLNKMFAGKSKVLEPNVQLLKMTDEVRDLDAILDELFKAMAAYELVKIYDVIQELKDIMLRLKNNISVYYYTLHFITKLEAYLRGINENIYTLIGLSVEELDVLYKYETVQDIQSWLIKHVFEISERLQMKKQKKNGKLIREIAAYVETHLSGPILLRDVAAHFSFSPNYLGYLFKEETGETFNDYVLRRRLEKAKELLLGTRLKIYEVANEAGFQNLTYFTRQFKEKFLLTPGDFRKQC